MNVRWSFVFAFWGSFAASSFAADPMRYAIVVGAKTYQNQELTTLDYACRDCQRLATILRENKYDVISLTSEEPEHLRPTLKAIREQIESILRKAKEQPEAIVLIYFSGHGLLDENNISYFCPQDADPDNPAKLIDLHALARTLGDAKIAHAFLFSDCCRDKRTGLKQSKANTNFDADSVGVVFSCETGQKAKGGTEKFPHSIFTKVLCDTLEGHYHDPGEGITWDKLQKSLPKLVEELARAQSHSQRVDNLSPRLASTLNLTIAVPPRGAPLDNGEKAEEMAKKLQEKWAKHLNLPKDGEIKLDSDHGLELRLIPPGRVLVGSPTNEVGRESKLEERREEVIELPFYMSTYETTQTQFKLLLGADRNLSRPKGPKFDLFPVNRISVKDTDEFCRKINQLLKEKPNEKWRNYTCRLPSEVEWEYACRGFTTSAFWFGDSVTTEEMAADLQKGYPTGINTRFTGRSLHPVDKFKPNPFGLYNMHGNVQELCRTGEKYFLRGGYFSAPPEKCRSARREAADPSNMDISEGFRIVLVPK